MGELLHFFKNLSNTSDWPTIWQSGNWTSFEGWLYIISNSIMWVSFLIISFTATRFAGKTGKGIMAQLSPVIIWLALTTSIVLFMDVFMFWIPAYRINSLMRACAAIVSIIGVYKLYKYIPALLSLRPASEIAPQITIYPTAEERVKALEDELQSVNEQRLKAVAETARTHELINELQNRLNEATEAKNNEITEVSRAHNNLKLLNNNLDQKVAERTMQMEAISRELNAFSYAVSHDIREPLRLTKRCADVLQSDHSSTLDSEGQRLLETIIGNTGHISEMIDALRTLERTGRKELMILPADMASIVKSSISELVTNTGSNARFDIGNILSVNCDSVLIRNVWSNLISNAIKFSAHLEQPVIHIGSEKKDGKVLYFIRDNGMGFDMQYVNKLFGVFQKLHKSANKNGAGIGLALVQRVVLMHGGYVWAEGQENKGAVFYFTLPEYKN